MKLTIKIISCISFFIIIGACNDKNERSDDSPPIKSGNPTIYEKAKPVALTPASTQDFINWASGSDLSERERIREEISKASKNEQVLSELINEFEKVDTADVGYSLIVLSIIGEMQNPKALPFFEKVATRELPRQTEEFHSGLTKRDVSEMLSSKAAECAAYLKSPESDRVLLNIISQHPSETVRSSAIDAYLYNKEDSEEAKRSLLQYVKEIDLKYIDRTRFTRDSKEESFDSMLAEFYEKHPKEIAPEPGLPTEKYEQGKDTTSLIKPIQPPKRQP